MAKAAAAKVGDNSVNKAAAQRLQSIIERVERLDEEKRALANDRKDVLAEAKSAGFDVKAIRALLKLRREDENELEEHIALVNLYRTALGMTPIDL